MKLPLLITAACLSGFALQACITPDPGDESKVVRENPLKAMKFYVDENSVVAKKVRSITSADPQTKQALNFLAEQPAAVWFGDWSGPIQAAVADAVQNAEAAGTHLVAVPYNIPYRDCGHYSAGGLVADTYREWIGDFAAGLGQHRAVVILEPDAIPLIDCLSSEARNERWELLGFALETIKSKSQAAVYMDIGHGNWIPPGILAQRLRAINIEKADGFAINTSNYQSNEDCIEFGRKLVRRFPGKGFVIDTSRNGKGPSADNAWCNPRGRAVGKLPKPVDGDPHLDAYLWIKRPGESDGECNGGPKAGEFWIDIARELVQNSPYTNN